MSDAVLERFHRALIEEIQTQCPEYLTSPFTVAEIYQNLVPYGTHRDRIGVEMNGDYEDALVRLLAGEGGYLILESEPALKKLKAELTTANPNTAVYRDYAAVDVRLNQAYLDLSESALDGLSDLADELEAEDPVVMADLAPAEGVQSELGIVPPGVDIFDDPGAGRDDGLGGENGGAKRTAVRPPLEPEFVEPRTPAKAAPASSPGAPSAGAPSAGAPSPPSPAASTPGAPAVTGGECKWCRGALPARPNARFCPHCGSDLAIVPCASCGEELEPAWRFCAACGTEVPI